VVVTPQEGRVIKTTAPANQPPGSFLGQNLQMMSQTVLSGADPALADIAGTSGIVQGTYPSSYNRALMASWFGGGTPTDASSSDTPAEAAVSDPGVMLKAGLMVLAIGVILVGAVALVMPGAARAMEG
jgi:hypothetical protein